MARHGTVVTGLERLLDEGPGCAGLGVGARVGVDPNRGAVVGVNAITRVGVGDGVSVAANVMVAVATGDVVRLKSGKVVGVVVGDTFGKVGSGLGGSVG